VLNDYKKKKKKKNLTPLLPPFCTLPSPPFCPLYQVSLARNVLVLTSVEHLVPDHLMSARVAQQQLPPCREELVLQAGRALDMAAGRGGVGGWGVKSSSCRPDEPWIWPLVGGRGVGGKRCIHIDCDRSVHRSTDFRTTHGGRCRAWLGIA
jgi:hypothetical protein